MDSTGNTNEVETLTDSRIRNALEVVWDAIGKYETLAEQHEIHVPIDDINTAMAWIQEALGEEEKTDEH